MLDETSLKLFTLTEQSKNVIYVHCKNYFDIFSCAIILLLLCLAFTVVSGKAFRNKKKELVPLATLSKLSDHHQDLTQTLTEASKLKKLTYIYAYTYTALYNLYKKAHILDLRDA